MYVFIEMFNLIMHFIHDIKDFFLCRLCNNCNKLITAIPSNKIFCWNGISQ